MSHVSDFQTKAVKKASREASAGVKGWTRVVPVHKCKKDRKKPTKFYLSEVQ